MPAMPRMAALCSGGEPLPMLVEAAATRHARSASDAGALGVIDLRPRRVDFKSAVVRYPTTSSARAMTAGGIEIASVFAVFALMKSSIFVACMTGSSLGFSPFSRRPV